MPEVRDQNVQNRRIITSAMYAGENPDSRLLRGRQGFILFRRASEDLALTAFFIVQSPPGDLPLPLLGEGVLLLKAKAVLHSGCNPCS